MKGEAISIEDMPDKTFADKLLGDGIAINPTDGTVVSPVDGTIALVYETKACHCNNY